MSFLAPPVLSAWASTRSHADELASDDDDCDRCRHTAIT